ncbi:MAG TPA: hypothetical protein VFP56_03430 [Candidatus Limnocylindrales bacterium]|nr:hypothetical protein [Candidatus Limnocylindrales bacterium]
MTEGISVPIEPAAFGLAPDEAEVVEHLGRRALRFVDGSFNALVAGVELVDGTIETDIAVPRERSFHGVVWRSAGADFESFFVRPHQVGNPDAIQYTPNPNGISSWQLYHGPGFWAPITFPIGDWCTIRVAFAGDRADIFVGNVHRPVLAVGELKLPRRAGDVGIQVGGPGLHVARFDYAIGTAPLVGVPEPEPSPHPGVIRHWEVSDAFPESDLDGAATVSEALLRARSWTPLEAERSGLANLGRIQPIKEDRNTALARATIESDVAVLRPLEIGFSDRATVFLNGRALFRGDETYRNRDYRFLGSIGWWDTVYLPLETGQNQLVIAVSEDFGGWGVQARFAGRSKPVARADRSRGVGHGARDVRPRNRDRLRGPLTRG